MRGVSLWGALFCGVRVFDPVAKSDVTESVTETTYFVTGIVTWFEFDETSTKMTFFVDKIVELSRIRRNRRRFCPFPSNNRRRCVTRKQKKDASFLRHPLEKQIVTGDYFIGLPKIRTSLSSFWLNVEAPNEPSD